MPYLALDVCYYEFATLHIGLISIAQNLKRARDVSGRKSYRRTRSSRTAEVTLSHTHSSRYPSLGSTGAAGRPPVHSCAKDREHEPDPDPPPRFRNTRARALLRVDCRIQSSGVNIYFSGPKRLKH